MAGHVALDHGIGVRIPAPQPIANPDSGSGPLCTVECNVQSRAAAAGEAIDHLETMVVEATKPQS